MKTYVELNEKTGKYVTRDAHTEAFNEIIKDALDYSLIRSDFLPVKDYFNNVILKEYSQAEFDQREVEQLVQKYSEMRINDCLLTPGFRDKLNSDNGHIYIKVLKEQIVDELKLTSEPKLQELSF